MNGWEALTVVSFFALIGFVIYIVSKYQKNDSEEKEKIDEFSNKG